MEIFVTIFQSISCILALLAAVILIGVNENQTHSKRILVLLLLVLSILNLNGVLFQTKWFLSYPQFHKIAIPFSVLVYPVAYLYIRSVLLGELRFRKTDWLLLLPTLLYAINLIPYYTMPAAEKKNYLAAYYQNNVLRSGDSEGFLPAYIFSFIRVGWSILFIWLNYRLIKRFKKQAGEKILKDNLQLLKWVTLLNGMLSGLITVALFIAIIAPIKKINLNILDFALGAFVLIICLKLFLKPSLLYGVFIPTNLTQDTVLPDIIAKFIPSTATIPVGEMELLVSEKRPSLIINETATLQYKMKVETFFQNNRLFLNSDYSLEHLVKDTQIPRYILSAFINQEYGMGFREYLNRYRVEYLIRNLDKPEWKQFTLEAIATECGFSSRSTFIKNFKEITGQTPSEYINNSSR